MKDGMRSIERVPSEQAIFIQVFLRTFFVAASVTLATLILGFRSPI